MKTYQIKIVLNHVKPPIWRKLLVPSGITLEVLHPVIQTAMGWDNAHLHEFTLDQQTYAPVNEDTSPEVIEETGVVLGSLINKEGATLTYTYDFGDDWRHTITLEKILPPAKSPLKCIDGKRACPPEDCGGIPGYENLLHAMRNPDDADSEELFEWMGGDFDPEYFSAEAINEMLGDFVMEPEEPSPQKKTTATARPVLSIVKEDNAIQPKLDEDKIDDAILALLTLTFHEDHHVTRAWKTFDWEAMTRLHARGYILNPVGKVKSVTMTDEGIARAKQLLVQLFSK